MLMKTIVQITLGIKDHRVASVRLEKGSFRIELAAKKRRRLPCSICHSRCRPKDTLNQRKWLHVSLWGIAVFLLYNPRRVTCPEHGVRVEYIPWSMGKKNISYPLITVLAFWARILAWDQVASLFNVSWHTVKTAVQAAVEYGRAQENYKGVTVIGIDEISRKKATFTIRTSTIWTKDG